MHIQQPSTSPGGTPGTGSGSTPGNGPPAPPPAGGDFKTLLSYLQQLRDWIKTTVTEVAAQVPGLQQGDVLPVLNGRWNSTVPQLGLACADAMRVAAPLFVTMDFTADQLTQVSEIVREIGEFTVMFNSAMAPFNDLCTRLRDRLCTMTQSVTGQVNAYRSMPALDDTTRSMADTAGGLIDNATAPAANRRTTGKKKAKAAREEGQATQSALQTRLTQLEDENTVLRGGEISSTPKTETGTPALANGTARRTTRGGRTTPRVRPTPARARTTKTKTKK